MTDHDGIEPLHDASPTDHVLSELQLFGYRPFDDQPDPRTLPEGKTITGAVADIFDALVATLSDTRLEPDLENLLWSTVNTFHRAVDRVGRQLDGNEQAQRKSQREQNGSEVQSVELERLTAEGITLIERRNCLELFRDQAIERFELHTGSSWRPRSGSVVNHRTLTAAMIDSGTSSQPSAAPRLRSCCHQAQKSHSLAASSSTTTVLSGIASTRFAPNIPTWS